MTASEGSEPLELLGQGEKKSLTILKSDHQPVATQSGLAKLVRHNRGREIKMGRWGPHSLNSDAAHDFLWGDFLSKFDETGSVNQAWAFFFDEWNGLPDSDKESWGFEYLFSAVELWYLEKQREGVMPENREDDEERVALLEAMVAEPINSKNKQSALMLAEWGVGFWQRRFTQKEPLSDKDQKDKGETIGCVEQMIELLKQ